MGIDTSLTLVNAPEQLTAWRRRVEAGEREFDLAGIDSVDSSALAVLLELQRQSTSPLRFSNPSANLRKLGDLYGVSALLFAEHTGP